MSAISTFPTIPGSIELADSVYTFTATAAVKRGQQVCFHGTGVDFSVIVGVLSGELLGAGVALEDADAAAKVPVKLYGPIVLMGNGTDGALDAGTLVMLGAVGAVDAATTTHTIYGICVETMPLL